MHCVQVLLDLGPARRNCSHRRQHVRGIYDRRSQFFFRFLCRVCWLCHQDASRNDRFWQLGYKRQSQICYARCVCLDLRSCDWRSRLFGHRVLFHPRGADGDGCGFHDRAHLFICGHPSRSSQESDLRGSRETVPVRVFHSFLQAPHRRGRLDHIRRRQRGVRSGGREGRKCVPATGRDRTPRAKGHQRGQVSLSDPFRSGEDARG
mmetsp:Transcript_43055/g.111514  ORF Transcript_43055/g.111514 Transcript_43055/m.111514 type:complete len:206 (-) Transcript_43055:4848-5465(-)